MLRCDQWWNWSSNSSYHTDCNLFLCISGYVVASIQQGLSQNHPQLQITFGLLGIIFKWRSKNVQRRSMSSSHCLSWRWAVCPSPQAASWRVWRGIRTMGNVRNPWLSNPPEIAWLRENGAKKTPFSQDQMSRAMGERGYECQNSSEWYFSNGLKPATRSL